MKKFLFGFVCILVAGAVQASHYVSPYSRSDGTYVQGHMSQDPGEARSTGYSYHNNQLEPNGY